MIEPPATLWRAFPWDSKAEEGRPFSASFVPAAQGWGRFDLTGEPAGVLYLAETADHAVGEKLQDLRNQTLEAGDLEEYGHPIALVEVDVRAAAGEIVDLCDPEELVRLGIRPDSICALDRTVTQEISRRLFDDGVRGFRWWSAFFGEWHTYVLFRDRLSGDPAYVKPRIVDVRSAALEEAARKLGITVHS